VLTTIDVLSGHAARTSAEEPIMSIRTVFLITVAVGVTGCAAAPLQFPHAAEILVSRNPPSPGCQLIGEVRGSQGNFWTAEFTKDEDLVVGARNEMRNAAYQMGANYVQIEFENQSHNTADHSSGGVYSSTIIGNAYACADGSSAQFVP